MTASKWFDYNGYMANKLVQVQKAEPAANWDMTKLVNTFADNGFAGAEGAEKHFEQFGQYEDVAPNAFFNATEYYAAKAAQFYNKDHKAVTDLDVASMQVAIQNAGMSAWSHYEQYGNTEGVNPSNSFDTAAYMTAKLDAMHATAAGKNMTMPQLNAAFKAAGLSALEHFMIYGGAGAGEVTMKYDGTIPTEFAVPEDKQVTNGGGSGKYIELTGNIDNLQGTAGNDVFVGTITTSQAMDSIHGNGGEDILRLDNVTAGLPGVIKGVQTFSFENNDAALTRDLSGYADLKHVVVKDALDAITLTVGKGVDVNLANLTRDKAMNVTFDKTDTAAKISLDNIADTTTTADFTVVGAALESLTLHTSGKDSALDSLVTTNTKINTLNITGDKSLTIKDNALDNAITKIDAGTFTGDLDLSVGSGKMNIIAGEGNDTFRFADATLTKDDVLDGGAGINTLVVNDTAVSYEGINKAKNFQVLEVGVTGLTYDLSKITNDMDTFVMGNFAAATFRNVDDTDTFFVNINGTTDVANTLTLSGDFLTKADVTFANDSLAASTADKLSATTVSNLHLTSDGKFANKVELELADAAVVSLDGETDITLTLKTAASMHMDLRAKDFEGKLTATGGDLLDKIVVGSGGSEITTSKGNDSITFGTGEDTLNVFIKPGSALVDMDTLTGFTSGQDAIAFVSATSPAIQTAITKVEAAYTTDLTTTLASATLAANAVTIVTVTGDASANGVYAVYSTNTAFAVGDDYIVKLAGVTAEQVVAGDFIVGS